MSPRYPVRSSDVAYRVIDSEAILVSGKKGMMYALNPVGTAVWELSDGATSLDEIARQIHERFEATLERATADCERFVSELMARRMLSIQDDPVVQA